MEHDQNTKLILQLLFEDLGDLEGKQKGKQPAGKQTDLELALSCMRNEILDAQNSINDGILALSMSTAIAMDQNILASMRHDERLAAQDHHYALALDNGEENVPDVATIGERVSTEDEDAVNIVMRDLMERLALSDKSVSQEGSSRQILSSKAKECVSCLEEYDSLLFIGSCGHGFCRACTRQMFLGAIKDEELYPPRCCGHIVPPAIALRILSYEELREFGERAIEYSAQDRVYCAEPTCSRFIPPSAIRDEHGTCPGCHQQTHLLCRLLAHPGVDCPMDDALHNVLALADAENWKRCFNCRTMVELQHGCNHITCRCGREFCYICGLVWKTCNCPLWHEDRLVAVANEAVHDEVAPNAGIVDRRNAFHRIVENLRRHEDVGCEHYRNSQWAWRNRGSLQCEVSNHSLPEYIFVCKNCRMRACYRCRRHRLR